MNRIQVFKTYLNKNFIYRIQLLKAYIVTTPITTTFILTMTATIIIKKVLFETPSNQENINIFIITFTGKPTKIVPKPDILQN